MAKPTDKPSIGLLNEKPLHAALKAWYAQPGDRTEVALDGFVIDLVRNDLLVEIQTANFAAIRSKLTRLVPSHRVRLLHPIARQKYIVKLATDDGQAMSRRKSPKRGRVEDLFWEMVAFPELVAHRNFSLEVVLTEEEEVRRHAPERAWYRRGWVIEERRLLDVIERRAFQTPADWRGFLPENAERFTASDVAEARGIRTPLAQKLVYCLRKAGLIAVIGKRGRAKLYALAGNPRVSRASALY